MQCTHSTVIVLPRARQAILCRSDRRSRRGLVANLTFTCVVPDTGECQSRDGRLSVGAFHITVVALPPPAHNFHQDRGRH